VQQPAQLAAVHAYTGLALLLAGRAQIAHEHFVQALAVQPAPVESSLLDIHALAGVQRVRCLLALGRPQEAGTLVDAALAHARRACVPMDLIQNLFWVADCLCRLDRSDEAGVLLDEMVTLAEAQALPHYRIAGEVCRQGLAPAVRRDLPRMEALLQQLLASGERWCDARLLALLAETRQAQGDAPGARQALAQAEALLGGMPVHAADVARARERLAQL
jgi:tetratricopeptide (TPR) repeat protein